METTESAMLDLLERIAATLEKMEGHLRMASVTEKTSVGPYDLADRNQDYEVRYFGKNGVEIPVRKDGTSAT